MNNKYYLQIVISLIAIFKRIEGKFDRQLTSPLKDMKRTSHGVCPACNSANGPEVISVPYYKIHRFMWGSPTSLYFKIVASKLWHAKFSVLICDVCGLRYISESYNGLTESVEKNPLYLQTIKGWSDICHPHIGKREIDSFNKEMSMDLNGSLLTYRNIYDVIFPYLLDGAKIIDIGSNVGTFAELMRNVNCNIEVFACEINQHYLRIGKKRYPKLNWIENEISHNDSSKKYDFVYASDVIEHIWDLDIFVRSLKGILSSNGYMMLITPNPECANALMMGCDWAGFLFPHHCQLFTKIAIEALLSRHSLRIIDAGSFSEEHWFICKHNSK